MDYRGNKIIFAKNSNAVTIFSQHVLFYAIDNPEFAQYLMNAGITTFVMADGSTINIETLKRHWGFKTILSLVAFVLIGCFILVASVRMNMLKDQLEMELRILSKKEEL